MSNEIKTSTAPDVEFEQRLLMYARKIAERGGSITPRDVRRRFWEFRKTSGEALLNLLIRRRLGRWEIRNPGPRGGRRSQIFVLNPGAGQGEQADPPNENSTST